MRRERRSPARSALSQAWRARPIIFGAVEKLALPADGEDVDALLSEPLEQLGEEPGELGLLGARATRPVARQRATGNLFEVEEIGGDAPDLRAHAVGVRPRGREHLTRLPGLRVFERADDTRDRALDNVARRHG